MHVFGKPERAVACDCERVNQPSLLQSVFLQNDPLVHLALEESGWLMAVRQQSAVDQDGLHGLITEAWLRAYGRKPADGERQRALQHLLQAETPAAGLEDLLWSLLNTKEFLLKRSDHKYLILNYRGPSKKLERSFDQREPPLQESSYHSLC